jgi:hypothetical protein
LRFFQIASKTKKELCPLSTRANGSEEADSEADDEEQAPPRRLWKRLRKKEKAQVVRGV